ncbi:MAG: stage II sporulation protein R [Clostridiales bacterium]|nr:stage II sporulation protein R [Clostridiales bacterium]
MKNISDEKKCIICFALVILMGVLLFYTYADDEGQNDHEGIIRLHVIANSNTVGDQALKLKVRDAIIKHMEKNAQTVTAAETEEYLKDNTERFEKIAEGVIASEGYNYPAGVTLGVRYIPEKNYGEITFPAGNYEALNVTIGDGEGENWWCVLFPPLCLLEEGCEMTDSDKNNTAVSSNLSEDQRLELRWKLIKLLNKN